MWRSCLCCTASCLGDLERGYTAGEDSAAVDVAATPAPPAPAPASTIATTPFIVCIPVRVEHPILQDAFSSGETKTKSSQYMHWKLRPCRAIVPSNQKT